MKKLYVYSRKDIGRENERLVKMLIFIWSLYELDKHRQGVGRTERETEWEEVRVGWRVGESWFKQVYKINQ